jgi:hypothetical protein
MGDRKACAIAADILAAAGGDGGEMSMEATRGFCAAIALLRRIEKAPDHEER